MRLLYTRKQFQGELEKVLKPIKDENESLNNIIKNKEFKYLSAKNKLEDENKQYQDLIVLREQEINRLENMIKELKSSHRKLASAKGGLIKKINELQDELSEAQIKLSQRYIVKELKPEKVKNTQIMKIKSSSKTSRIAKKMKEAEND